MSTSTVAPWRRARSHAASMYRAPWAWALMASRGTLRWRYTKRKVEHVVGAKRAFIEIESHRVAVETVPEEVATFLELAASAGKERNPHALRRRRCCHQKAQCVVRAIVQRFQSKKMRGQRVGELRRQGGNVRGERLPIIAEPF